MVQISKINMDGIDYAIRDKVLEEDVNKIKQIINQGIINNTADEEDLTSENNMLKFKDRSTLDGMGYIILRKNKSFSEQVTKENTIYEIRYNFILEENIIIPANCILKFNGGSISGENTITGNNTKIQANKKIFDNNITFAGTWNCTQIESYWWDIRENDSTYDNAPSIQKGVDLAALNKGGLLHISGGKLYVNVVISDHSYEFWSYVTGAIVLKSNIHIVIDSGTTIKAIDNTEQRYSIFQIFNVSNVSIYGGNIIGDIDTNAGAKSGEWGYGISIFSSNNVIVRNCNISYCHGDGIMVGRIADLNTYPVDMTNRTMIPHNITISDCIISYCGRQGISICGAIDSVVKNCYIFGVGLGGYYAAPGSAIDIEPNPSLYDEIAENLTIKNIVCHRNSGGTIMIADFSKDLRMLNNVIVQSVVADKRNEPSCIRLVNAYNTIVTDCKFTFARLQTTKSNTELVNINNCSISGFIELTDGAKDIIISNCSIYADSESGMIKFRGNNANIFFNNCSMYQNDRRDILNYASPSESITYNKIIFNNCSFVSSATQPEDAIGTHNNSVWALCPVYN